MKHFVAEDSIVREIWGKADTILVIFAGAAAEFALNKAVDWLYFTGKLPADPLGRLFSTVAYAKQIIFSTNEDALAAIDKITAIHQHVEAARGSQIPDWAYRDVLFMLIDYSIRAFELLEYPMTQEEKSEVFKTFYKVGVRMKLKGLPTNYYAWEIMRAIHLKQDLQPGVYTQDLFKKYRAHLGGMRYLLLRQVQSLLVPAIVKQYLSLSNAKLLLPLLYIYKLTKPPLLRNLLMPGAYLSQIKQLDQLSHR
jgi:hypothetical protein